MGPGDGEDESRAVIFHEYVHHLVRVSGEEPPPWYNEGIAELFSSIEVHDDHLVLGRPHAGRVAELQAAKFLPLEQIFGTTYFSPLFRDGRHTGVFYSQSWAFVHFCYFGSSKLPRDKLEQFLRIARVPRISADPEQLRAICRELLGMDFPELNRELERYMHGGKYSWGRLPLPPIAPLASYSVQPVPPAEIAVRLADLHLRVERSPAAKLALILAAERAPQDARLQEVLGAAARVEGDEAGARDRWRRAVELGTTNPAVFHELGLLETRRWFQLFDLDFRMPDQIAADLRDLLKRSIVAAPEQSEAYEMLALIEASAREPDIANVNLVQARYPTLKDKPRTLLALAMIRWRKDDDATAVKLLDALREMETGEPVRQAAEHLRAALEDRAPTLTLLPGTSPSKAPAVRVPKLRPSGEVTLPPPR